MATVRHPLREHRVWREAALGVGALALGAAGGIAVAAGNPLLPFLVLAGLLPLPWLLTRPQLDLLLVVGVITLLPFGTLPVKIGLTPTFLEIGLVLLAGVGLFSQTRGADAAERSLVRTPLDAWMLLFLGIISFAFVLGLARDASSDLIHNYVKLILAITVFFTATQVLRTPAAIAALVRGLVAGGGLAALVALLLWRLPQALATRLLLGLRPLGYPTDRVLRFVNDDPAQGERATGTSVDPNSLGGLLVVIFALTLTQLLGRRPVFPRPLLAGLLAADGLAILLTQSRGAWLAAAAAAAFVGLLRYRKFLGVMILAGVAVPVLGLGGAFLARLQTGLAFQDQAQLMRLGEFQNAATIIARYPFFGVGFGTAGELDLTTGVSSIYLTLAERTGLFGLAAFLALMIVFFVLLAPRLRAPRVPATGDAALLDATLLGTGAAVTGALVVGVADHYYFNIEQSHLAALLWLCLALGLAARRLLAEHDAAGAQSPQSANSMAVKGASNAGRTGGLR